VDALLEIIGVGAVVFASTNVDDIVLLSLFFADPELRPRDIVAGQLLGIGALVAASAAAGALGSVVPEGVVALLGLVPLALGLRKLWELRATDADAADADAADEIERRPGVRALAVAAVTVANGGDNLGVYIPLFAREPAHVPGYAAVFGAMTLLWCLAGYALVRNPVFGPRVRRFGRVVMPLVLVALGLWILAGAG
jgi:cadmium resistance protein CadD (predicted permease)